MDSSAQAKEKTNQLKEAGSSRTRITLKPIPPEVVKKMEDEKHSEKLRVSLITTLYDTIQYGVYDYFMANQPVPQGDNSMSGSVKLKDGKKPRSIFGPIFQLIIQPVL